MTEREKKEILGRLAARETASLKALDIEQTASADKIAAFSNIIAELNAPIQNAKHFYKKCVDQLQQADLTINFKAYCFFNAIPKGRGYVNQFSGGNKWGGASYVAIRDSVEEGLFDYSNIKSRVFAVPGQVMNRISSLGKFSNPTFEPTMRPKYAALNYANLPSGSAAQWGKSYMVLKEYVKHNATYIHTDSFDQSGASQLQAIGGQVATYNDLSRVIANMPPAMLRALYAASNGISPGNVDQVPGVGSTSYVEAHVHGEINFDRDIAKMYISHKELSEAHVMLPLVIKSDQDNHRPQRFKLVDSAKLQSNFLKFTGKYKIDYEMY